MVFSVNDPKSIALLFNDNTELAEFLVAILESRVTCSPTEYNYSDFFMALKAAFKVVKVASVKPQVEEHIIDRLHGLSIMV